VSAAPFDLALMGRALDLAKGQLGRTAPNPTVGCVLAHGGASVSAGVTGDGGRPHAEEVAVAAAGGRALGATAYVTLEPCARRSSGAAACSDVLIAAGVVRVVVAAPDPHAFAAGQGLARLRSAGVAVEVGFRQIEAEAINAGFFRVVREGMPLIALASDAAGFDARFAPPPGADLRSALEAAARAGLTRVYTDDAALADRLGALGLLSLPTPA